MEHPGFFKRAGPFTLAEIAAYHTGGSEGRSDGDEPMRMAGESQAGERALDS